MRIGVVLSGGGLRGAAHLGVLRRLRANGIEPEILVGVSAGAVISAFHAAVGLTIEELIAEARGFRGRHLLAHGLRLRLPEFLDRRLAPYCGVIPRRLGQLEKARFSELKFGVKGLGIVCHDTLTGKPAYFCSGDSFEAPLAQVVRASAAIPVVMPARSLECGGRAFRLIDGGVSDPVPLDFAFDPRLGATHVLISDCGSDRIELTNSANVIHLRHALRGVGVLRSPRETLSQAVTEGEASVTAEVLARVRAWA